MRYQGKITSWNEERGFGFIEWNGASDRLFVHIRAFERSRRKPAIGDIVSYGVGRDERGRPQALDVRFTGTTSLPKRTEARTKRSVRWGLPVKVLLLAGLGLWAYQRYGLDDAQNIRTPFASDMRRATTVRGEAEEAQRFQCEGKTRCPEMASCEEALFYLRNCPGSLSDGDGDGIPCEDQWCAGLR